MSGRAVRCGPAEKHGRRWRVAEIAGDGSRSHRYFETESEARNYVIVFRQEASGRSIGTTVNEYLEHGARYGGQKRRPWTPATRAKMRSMLIGFLQLEPTRERAANRGKRKPDDVPMTDRPLESLALKGVPPRLYRERRESLKSNGQPISADTHRAELAVAKMFCEWCVMVGYLKENPFAGVLPEGELSRGKAQLMFDEARQFIHAAYSSQHPLLGVAAAAVLTLGLRSNELLDRVVRDLDDGGRILWITHGKTANAKRRLAVPPILRAALLKLTLGRQPDEMIFGTLTDGTLLKYVHELCRSLAITDVCTHGLRGTQITLTVAVAQDVERASRAAGHGGTGVTRAHYLAAGVEQSARAKLMEEILLTDTDGDERRAEIEAAEREAREANEKLARMRNRVEAYCERN